MPLKPGDNVMSGAEAVRAMTTAMANEPGGSTSLERELRSVQDEGRITQLIRRLTSANGQTESGNKAR